MPDVKINIDLAAKGGAPAVMRDLQKSAYAASQTLKNLEGSLKAIGSPLHVEALRRQLLVNQKINDIKRQINLVESKAIGSPLQIAALRSQLALNQQIADSKRRQQQAQNIAQYGAIGGGARNLFDSAKEGLAPFLETIRGMDSIFQRATGAVIGFSAAAGSSVIRTWTGSWQLLALAIENRFIPQMTAASFLVQDVARWIRGLDREQMANIARWVEWGIAIAGVGTAIVILGGVINGAITIFGLLAQAGRGLLFVFGLLRIGVYALSNTLLGTAFSASAMNMSLLSASGGAVTMTGTVRTLTMALSRLLFVWGAIAVLQETGLLGLTPAQQQTAQQTAAALNPAVPGSAQATAQAAVQAALQQQQGRNILGGLPVVASERMDAILRALGHTGARSFLGQRPAAESELAERIFAAIGGRPALQAASLSPESLQNIAAIAAAQGRPQPAAGTPAAAIASAAAAGVPAWVTNAAASVVVAQAAMRPNFNPFTQGAGAAGQQGVLASTFQPQFFENAADLLQHVLMQTQRSEMDRLIEAQQANNEAAAGTAAAVGANDGSGGIIAVLRAWVQSWTNAQGGPS